MDGAKELPKEDLRRLGLLLQEMLFPTSSFHVGMELD